MNNKNNETTKVQIGDNMFELHATDYKKYLEDNTGMISLSPEEPAINLNIKYFPGATKLGQIEKGNWIDVYANEEVQLAVGESALVKLGFALELPKGVEGHLAPRSSTFKKWGIMLTNGVGIIDDTYIGDNDEWMFSCICMQGREKIFDGKDDYIDGTIIRKGDKIGQFRLLDAMPKIKFNEVEHLSGPNRGGFGTTGSK